MAPKVKPRVPLPPTRGRLTDFFPGSNPKSASIVEHVIDNSEDFDATPQVDGGTSNVPSTSQAIQDSLPCSQQLDQETQGTCLTNEAKAKDKKRKKGEWTIGRAFQSDWVSRFPFIQPVKSENDKPPKFANCIACSWKMGRDLTLQLKLDTIEKHIGKVYEKEEVDGKIINIVKWKSAEECRHVRFMALYEAHLLQLDQNMKAGELIRHLHEKKVVKDGQSTIAQFVIVLHILSTGKPMADYPKWRQPLSFIGIHVPEFPTRYWNEPSGWEFAKFMGDVIKGNLQQRLAAAKFIAVSLDEVTARNNTSWACINVYFVEKHVRQACYLGIFKLAKSATSDILTKLVIDGLTTLGCLTLKEISQKVICVGVDGASVMHGCRAGLCVQVQTSFAPYMLGIHCMAHRTNLAYKILTKFNAVQKVEDLVRKAYSFFSKSPKRHNEFKMFAEGVTQGRKLLKQVNTRWISLVGPVQRLFEEYRSVIGVVYEMAQKKGKGQEKARRLLELLSDVETFLYLGGLLPMLHEMNVLIKIAQKRDCYIMEYTTARRLTCLQLNTLYGEGSSFTAEQFAKWKSFLNVGSPSSFLKYDDNGNLCMEVKGNLIKLHVKRTVKEVHKCRRVKEANFPILIDFVRKNLISICNTLTNEIRERFPRDELLESMAIIHPMYWNNTKDKQNLLIDFTNKVRIISEHFGKSVELHGVKMNGILDPNELIQQSGVFGQTMWEQYSLLEEPSKPGAITRLWNKLSMSVYLQDRMSEYFKLTDLCQTMILGSIEDERVFSSLTFIKSNLRNKLEKNLDCCLRLYAAKPKLETFPFEEAYALWDSFCHRRGGNDASHTTIDGASSSFDLQSFQIPAL